MTPRVGILHGPEALAARPALAEILADCVAGGASVSFMSPFPAEAAAAWWDGVLEAERTGRTVLFGAWLGDDLVGTVQLGLDTPPNQPHRADLKKLLVHRRARERGVARALMGAAEAEARRRGLTLLVLDTVTGSPAERLYAGLGWNRVGIIPNYALWPDGRLCDTTVFWKTP